MKKVISFILFVFVGISVISAQDAREKKNPVGQWKFEAPYAPEGYTSGFFEVGYAEGKYSAAIILTGVDYRFPGEQVKFANDSLSFFVSFEDEYVSLKLKLEDNTKMSGKAYYSEGEIPVSLTKEIIKDTR